MSDSPKASRSAPANIASIEINGVRYQQEMSSGYYGGAQLGGYLSAWDIQSGKHLWMLKVYDVADSGPDASIAAAIYFKSMKRIDGQDKMEIENEVKGKYQVDVTNRSVTTIAEPSANNNLPPPQLPKMF